MSGSFPTSPAPAMVYITSMSPNFGSVTHSMKRQVRRRGGGVHRWNIKIEFNPMKRVTAEPLISFTIKQSGAYETFQFTPPSAFAGALGDYSGTVTVNGVHSAGDNTIAVSGSSGTLGNGSYVKFADHTKVYKVVADSTTSITIFPGLQEEVADTTAVTYDCPPFTVALTSDNFTFSLGSAPALYNFEATFLEDY